MSDQDLSNPWDVGGSWASDWSWAESLATPAVGAGPAGDEGTAASRSRAWPKLDPAKVYPRIAELAGDPNLFNQGAIGVCTAAAFFHHVAQKNPEDFSSFARALYSGGIGYIGGLKVAPGADLRNADYDDLARRYSSMPPQADWMVMCALRDSENWLLDFEGSPEENVAMTTSGDEMVGWYRRTGWYSRVEAQVLEDRAVEVLKAWAKGDGNQVALAINTRLIGDSRAGGHMITLEAPMLIHEEKDVVHIGYWSWGAKHSITTNVAALRENCFWIACAYY